MDKYKIGTFFYKQNKNTVPANVPLHRNPGGGGWVGGTGIGWALSKPPRWLQMVRVSHETVEHPTDGDVGAQVRQLLW